MDIIIYVVSFLIIVGFLKKTFSSETDVKKLQNFKSEVLDLGTDVVSTSRQVLRASREVLDFKWLAVERSNPLYSLLFISFNPSHYLFTSLRHYST